MIKNYFLLKGTTSFRVLNIAILAYSYGLSSGLSANSTSKQTSTNPVEPYQIEFNRRKAMIQKWLAFRAKHDLQKISSSPYGYSLLEAKILHF